MFVLTHADGVIEYLSEDANLDYWEADANRQTRWLGQGAEELGLRGEVDSTAFARLLDGHVDDTVLGTVRGDVREHKPGTDVVLNAPKSVSVMALVAGDQRLIEAHLSAVTQAMGYAERHAAVVRIRRDRATVEHVVTENAVTASYLHTTARPTPSAPADPMLHSHNIVLNMSRRADGEWRSTENYHLLKLRRQIGSVYLQELAAEAGRLGYSVTFNQDGTFRLDAVPQVVVDAFSHRSAQIEADLKAQGHTRDSATVAHKTMIARKTRSAKLKSDGAELAAAWRTTADALGFDSEARHGAVAEAEARTRSKRLRLRGRARAADQAVATAAAKLAERDATFSAAHLEGEAAVMVAGEATHQDVRNAVMRATTQGALLRRRAPRAASGSAGFTTREAVECERTMLAIEAEGRNRIAPLLDPIGSARIVEAAAIGAKNLGHEWNDGQRSAAKGLLQSRSRITGLQGYAGTAKTSTVIQVVADAARAQGYTVRALAPTSTAAATLADAIGVEGTTVAHALMHGFNQAPGEKVVEIVDEASMLSTIDTAKLLEHARRTGNRLFLVGDVAQLGSVEAGRAFHQLQQHGMATFTLDTIVRQTNPHTRKAVEALIAGNATKAFASLDTAAGGTAIVEHDKAEIRRVLLARDFLKLSPGERAETIVLDPTRDGRRQLAKTIRSGLIREGALGAEAVAATVLESRDLGPTDRKRALNYRHGDVITFRRGYPKKGVATGTGYMVAEVDGKTVRLIDPIGKAIAWTPGSWGSTSAEVFAEVEAEFRVGDRLMFARNDRHQDRRNGMVAMVTGVDPARAGVMVAMPNGTEQALDLRRIGDRHVRQGWVQTVHSAQGATANTVLAHLESFRQGIDARLLYVAVSRARDQARLYTDNRIRLTIATDLRNGFQTAALDEEIDLGFGMN
ncbi:MobF family relaxase [Polymorphobacter megasporae]|uniref:MobF family relaxase n=1 Tax=Glacieibacterium megasporae TaxID=2835787 RepID=UPI001C1E0242|nr:MobF family relaxase [Polymorphobacter megasporae]UAJ10048.1 relaxase domain-containing protein [Polymorphobacter megasporae]